MLHCLQMTIHYFLLVKKKRKERKKLLFPSLKVKFAVCNEVKVKVFINTLTSKICPVPLPSGCYTFPSEQVIRIYCLIKIATST